MMKKYWQYCLVMMCFCSQSLMAQSVGLHTERYHNDALKLDVKITSPHLPKKNRAFNQAVKSFTESQVEKVKRKLVNDKELPIELKVNNSIQIDTEIVYQSRDLYSVLLKVSTYMVGAAHPNLELYTLNYDGVSDKVYDLGNIFQVSSPYLKTLSQACRQHFLMPTNAPDLAAGSKNVPSVTGPRGQAAGRSVNQTEGSRGPQQYKDFEKQWVFEGTKPVASTFSRWNFDSQGLIINFNPYQVAAYVYGPQSVPISYQSLAKLMNPKTRLYQSLVSPKGK